MSDYSEILEHTVDRLFGDIAEREAANAPESELWDQIEELGIADIFLPEDEGGMSGCWMDASIVFRLSGYHAVALPVGETMIARKILRQHDVALPSGPMTIAHSPTGAVSASSIEGNHVFTGGVISRSTSAHGSMLLSSLPDKEGFSYILLNPENASEVFEHQNVAGETRREYIFHEAKARAISGSASAPEILLGYGALLRASQSAGALSACLEKCIQYTHERSQFGRPLKKFQAIQHQLALLAEEAAAVGSAAAAACLAMDRGDASFEAACAKLRANQSVGPATSIAHQVHGAIGFTKEYGLHRHTQRLWAWRSEFGNDRHWAHYLGRYMLSLDGQSPWSLITARGEG